MKELMIEMKLSTWDNGTIFILTREGAYPFCGSRFDDCSAPTMAEIEKCVKEFEDEDMSGCRSFPLSDERVAEAKTVWSVVRPEQTLPDAANAIINFKREVVGELSIETLSIRTFIGTTFNIPDLRGQYIRGRDNGKAATERFSASYEDRDGDELSITSNNSIDPSNGDLFFGSSESGVVLKREQALDLAARINAYFTSN